MTPAELATALSNACGCEEVLYLIIGKDKFKGEIVATPSGPRSILTSVPQHIIVPYEEPTYLSPCDRRRLNPPPEPALAPPVGDQPADPNNPPQPPNPA
jgi:hypothetical protein